MADHEGRPEHRPSWSCSSGWIGALEPIADAKGCLSAYPALTNDPFIADDPEAVEIAKRLYDGTYLQ